MDVLAVKVDVEHTVPLAVAVRVMEGLALTVAHRVAVAEGVGVPEDVLQSEYRVDGEALTDRLRAAEGVDAHDPLAEFERNGVGLVLTVMVMLCVPLVQML